jgi:hypothetical protein
MTIVIETVRDHLIAKKPAQWQSGATPGVADKLEFRGSDHVLANQSRYRFQELRLTRPGS